MIYQEYQKTVLDNGLTVISEHIPFVRSISLGVWIKAGSRFESADRNGVAHFLEHMMFKATRRRSSRQIVRSLESLGGNLNAFTSKEQTCYYVEILDEHLSKAIDVLADILQRSGFSESDFQKEKGIILDEIQSLEDTPDEMIQDYLVEKLFPGHGLGLPILGSYETVTRMTIDELIDFYRQYYCNKNIVIAAAGNVLHQQLLHLCEQKFRFADGEINGRFERPRVVHGGDFVFDKPFHQAHICMGIPGYAYAHPRRYEILLLNTVLGGGMGSRLFQNIRERYGLAYGIYSFIDFYMDQGLVGVYLGTDRKNLGRATGLLEKEFERLRKKPVSQRELTEAKSQLKGNLVLGLESTAARMNRLAMLELYFGKFRTINEVIDDIERVTQECFWQTTRELFNQNRFVKVVFEPQP